MIAIIDYGLGNLASIQNMFRKIDVESEITSNPKKIMMATKLILPGVGAFDHGMENLKKLKLIPAIEEQVLKRKIPILGICLGMQLMTGKSEEGKLPGLGWINAETVKFAFTSEKLKVPHMGWNSVTVDKKHYLTQELPRNSRFYFVHSYHVILENKADNLMTTDYGGNFTSAFQRENIMGVQFHPEKSHQFGMQLLENFGRKDLC